MSLPDREAIDIEVKSLAEEAREHVNAAPPAGAAPTGSIAAPVYLGKSHEFIPVKYILHFMEVRCLNCGCVSHESKFYAMNYIRSRITDQRVKHLVPCDRPEFNIPVERLPLKPHTTPFCAECEVIDLTHLPGPPMESKLYDLDEPRLKGQKPKTKAEPKPQKPRGATADELA